ncbi:hypothetical protein Scani_69320 [Streptomyces caniferus]|uniref:Uncharacterized protein n=1 Tax=Streptomyces caniferus TaxID=285557 RepID=A0A640SIK0_9ACTN|nr:hypothetical protein Scani_69320 [Streptomyces caniferus]
MQNTGPAPAGSKRPPNRRTVPAPAASPVTVGTGCDTAPARPGARATADAPMPLSRHSRRAADPQGRPPARET